jgi:hypothetical protein
VADEGLLARLLLQQAARDQAHTDVGKYKRKADAILEQLLPMQRDLALDPRKRLALLTPGRTGKTFTVRAHLFRSALTQPGSLNVYIGLTRLKARQEIWEGPSGIVNLCERLGLKEPEVTFNRQEMLFRIPSLNSTIMCGGADDKKTIEVYRGGPGYEVVWIDEAKSHDADLLDVLIDDILVPRINARNGVLGICGTPGSMLRGQFYDITRSSSELSVAFGEENPVEDLKWSMHRWNLAMNTTKVPKTDLSLWQLALRMKKAKEWTDQNPTWMREYLGLWAADDTDFCYRFRAYTDDGAEFNTWSPAPPTSDNPFGLPTVAKLEGGDVAIKWQFAIGLDLGSTDPCALEVLAFSEQTKRIYHVHEWYRQTLSIDAIADALVEAVKKVQRYTEYPAAIVGDTAGMGVTILEEVRMKTGHRVAPAVKADKLGFIGLVNDDLVDGRLKLLRKSHVAEEMASLQWDDSGKRENKAQPNHGCDGTLYARGAIIRFLSRTEPLADTPKSPEEARLDEVFAQLGGKRGGDTYQPGGMYVPD